MRRSLVNAVSAVAAVNAVLAVCIWWDAPDEFELEPEWDSEDSNAFQDRVEAGLESQWSDD